MALGDKDKREELKRLVETSNLGEPDKQKIRDFVDDLENGELARLVEDVKRRSESN